MTNIKYLLLFFSVLVSLAGCGDIKKPESEVSLRKDIDLSNISRLAVLPFGYLTGGEYSARRVREIFISELISSSKFDVVDRDIVDATLREMAIDYENSLDRSVLNILAKKLEVNAFMSGTVNRVEGRGWGRPPYQEISLTLTLIDAETAKVLWRSTAYRNAYSDSRVFTVDPKRKIEITRKLLQDMIFSIPK